MDGNADGKLSHLACSDLVSQSLEAGWLAIGGLKKKLGTKSRMGMEV